MQRLRPDPGGELMDCEDVQRIGAMLGSAPKQILDSANLMRYCGPWEAGHMVRAHRRLISAYLGGPISCGLVSPASPGRRGIVRQAARVAAPLRALYATRCPGVQMVPGFLWSDGATSRGREYRGSGSGQAGRNMPHRTTSKEAEGYCHRLVSCGLGIPGSQTPA